MTEQHHDNLGGIPPMGAWALPEFHFAPVGTPLPKSTYENLSPMYSRGGWVTTPCAHCGLAHDRPMAWLRQAGQWPVHLCHDQNRDCYHRVTVYGDRLGSRIKPETHDEWRRLLGLPDVPADVKIRARWRNLSEEMDKIGQAIQKFGARVSIALAPWQANYLAAAMKAEEAQARDHVLRAHGLDLDLEASRRHSVMLGGKLPSWVDELAPPEPDTVQQRALPKPATTPPMWANNPTKSRRKR